MLLILSTRCRFVFVRKLIRIKTVSFGDENTETASLYLVMWWDCLHHQWRTSCPNFLEFLMSGLGVMYSSVQVFVSILHSPKLTDMMHASSLFFCIHLIHANFTFFTERSPSSGTWNCFGTKAIGLNIKDPQKEICFHLNHCFLVSGLVHFKQMLTYLHLFSGEYGFIYCTLSQEMKGHFFSIFTFHGHC